MKKQLSLLVIAGVLAAPVLAEGFYAGAEVGRTNMKGEGDTKAIKGNATDVGVFAGYQFHPNVAVEAGYRDLGKVKSSPSDGVNVSAKSRALHASVLGIVPVTDELSLYGRVGVAKLNTKLAANVAMPGNSFVPRSDVKGMFGLGARYAVSKEFGLRTEYTQFSKIGGNLKISTFTVGGDYSF
ncbi:outer membrane beta-barrel protein [Chitinimonas sp. BJB300]|uniref:outer membrane beta-barrel protein n=1 Tax=Chitinimonas sp. BJB300 TaxID=1559339 RepID=UPI000C0DC2A4|nr:outer membrane beta-barrel protein [Chitinimonas sp. BJB300]PHV12277.1 hypothetical protein CSQ89_06355 [Chitinimonas sp. BJB300]TSJ88138.1 outer membrane beta-barrel protein [Chitinimonas sp. BJB300]